MQEEADDTDIYSRYNIQEIRRCIIRSKVTDATRPWANFGSALHVLLNDLCVHKNKVNKLVYMNYRAAAKILDYIMSPQNSNNLTVEQHNIADRAAELALETSTVGMHACKIGRSVIMHLKDNYIRPSSRCTQWRKYYAANRGIESIRLNSMTPQIREHYDRIRISIPTHP